jgi:hypothetical protein
LFRLKSRHERRSDFAIEPVWSFYPKFAYETLTKYVQMARLGMRLYARSRTLINATRDGTFDAAHVRATDQALIPVTEGETDRLEIFTQNDSARHAVEHARKIAQLTGMDARAKAEAAV